MTHSPFRDIDDRIRALTEELHTADAVNLATASKTTLILNQERLRGGLADAIRLIEELRQHIADHEDRQ